MKEEAKYFFVASAIDDETWDTCAIVKAVLNSSIYYSSSYTTFWFSQDIPFISILLYNNL